MTQGYGNWVEFGEELEYRIRAVGSREFLAQARLQLVENPSAGYRQEVPWYCLPGISNGRVCYEMYNRRGVKAGFATF